jgi:hypothetical protein
MKICKFTGECELKDTGTVPYCKADYNCSYQKLNQAEVIKSVCRLNAFDNGYCKNYKINAVDCSDCDHRQTVIKCLL